MRRRKVANLLGLGILGILAPGRPMHPYEMATVLKATGKDQDMKIKWGSLYTVVQNLEKYGFIAATGTERAGKRPERTSYAITDAGRAELVDWLRELVRDPEPEQNRFEAALSVVAVLPPDEVLALLRERLRRLETDVAARRSIVEHSRQRGLVRVFLLEAEYALALRTAEADWTRSLLEEFTDGTLSGLAQWRKYHETGEMDSTIEAQWTELLDS